MQEDDLDELIDQVIGQLASTDDPEAWRTILRHIIPEATYLCGENPDRQAIVMEIGCCSHWLRPHQTRWTASGGFAWPSGYNGPPYSRVGKPEHDWQERFSWDRKSDRWKAERLPSTRTLPKRGLEFRVSIPARTMRHPQAAVSTIWSPGSPPLPKKALKQFYGFRQVKGTWHCVATSGPTHAYNAVATA